MSLRPLREALDGWTPGRGVAADPLHAIAAAWPGIVGANVAANSSPLEISANVLIVATRSSAWSQQLQFLSLPILAGIRELPHGAAIERLAFRVGAMRRPDRRRTGSPAAVRRKRHAVQSSPEPAADLEEAFDRLRRRMESLARARDAACSRCRAPLEPVAEGASSPSAVPYCAPCAGAAENERLIAVQRSVYMAPWLTIDDLREQLPDLGTAEFEGVRKRLLQRWWLVLERARIAGRVSASGVERHVGSAYVLLQSRLPPDRITAAVVRNLLGPELEKLLWPHGPG